jgi:hypothetical protein
MNKDRNDLSSSDYPWFGTSLEDSAVEDEDEQKPQPIKRARQYSLSTLATNSYGVTGLSTNYNPCDTEADDIQDVWTSGDDSDYNEEAWPSSTVWRAVFVTKLKCHTHFLFFKNLIRAKMILILKYIQRNHNQKSYHKQEKIGMQNFKKSSSKKTLQQNTKHYLH